MSCAFLKILVIFCKKHTWLSGRDESLVKVLQVLGQWMKNLARIAKGVGELQRRAWLSPKDKPLACFVGGALAG